MYKLTDEVETKVLLQYPERTNRMSATRAGLLEFPNVILDAILTECVHALQESNWIFHHVATNGALKLLLQLVK